MSILNVLQIWTVYMELYVRNSTALIVEFWQKFIGRLTYLMNGDMEENVMIIVFMDCW